MTNEERVEKALREGGVKALESGIAAVVSYWDEGRRVTVVSKLPGKSPMHLDSVVLATIRGLLQPLG